MKRYFPPYDGIWPALVTPMDHADGINLKATRLLVARLIAEGAAGLYVCGSTGEAPLLRVEERRLITECVISEVAGQIPIMVQVGHTAPVLAAELADHAARCGADAISATLPPFYSYTPGQIAGFWASLTRGNDLPFYGYVMHDLGQSRSQVYQWLEVIGRVPRLAGLKFTNADAHQLSLLKSWEDGRLNILSGHDQGYLACRVQGAEGAIGTTYNIALPLWRQVSDLYEAGDTAGATKAMSRCCEVVGLLTGGGFFSKVKGVLRLQAIDCGLPRPPCRAEVEPPEAVIQEIADLIRRYTPGPPGGAAGRGGTR